MQRALSQRVAGMGHVLSSVFPPPEFLLPRAAGIDISDASIKWVALAPEKNGCRAVEAWGQESLAEGIVSAGVVRDEAGLSQALREVKKKMPRAYEIHASLPEEPAFVFGMSVPVGSSRQQILDQVEFEFEGRVPIPPSAAVYDVDLIPMREGEAQEIGVVVFPLDIAESYARAFRQAGLALRSFELESRAIARAAYPPGEQGDVSLLVDFGSKRTGLAVLKRGIPIFTSTVEVGISAIDRALTETLKLSPEELEQWKNEQGLLPAEGQRSPGLEALAGAASGLGSEIARHFNYWDTRRNERGERVTPVSRVLLVGGGAHLKGLGDYIAGRVHSPVIRPSVWANVCSFDTYIPPIDRRASLRYATAIGLSLREYL